MLKEVAPGNSVRLAQAAPCSIKRRSFTLHVPNVPGTWQPVRCAECTCNEKRALINRCLAVGPGGKPTEDGLFEMRKQLWILRREMAHRRCDPMPTERVLARYSGPKLAKYQRAALSLGVRPIDRRDATVNAFIKAETNPLEADKDPRLIQFRNARYTISLARYLLPIEEALYGVMSRKAQRVGARTRLFAKGMNQGERARCIAQKLEGFNAGVAAAVDVSRFDMSVSLDMLRLEHGFYNWFHRCPELRRLLKFQERNRGRTMSGIKYTVTGNRMSGDVNTALGNNLLMLAVLRAAVEEAGMTRWDLLIDGDNALIFGERDELPGAFPTIEAMYAKCGMKAVLERWCSRPEEVEFCRARPTLTADGLRLVKPPLDAMSGMLCSHRHYGEPRGGLRVAKSVALCNLALYRGVPVMQPYCVRLLEVLAHLKPAALPDHHPLVIRAKAEIGRWVDAVPAPITFAARESFAEAFGIGPEDQVAMEAEVCRVDLQDLDLWGLRSLPREWYPGRERAHLVSVRQHWGQEGLWEKQ